MLFSNVARGQFHQRFTSSFCIHIHQKRKKDTRRLDCLFTLLGSLRVKAARKHVDEIDPKNEALQSVISSMNPKKVNKGEETKADVALDEKNECHCKEKTKYQFTVKKSRKFKRDLN